MKNTDLKKRTIYENDKRIITIIDYNNKQFVVSNDTDTFKEYEFSFNQLWDIEKVILSERWDAAFLISWYDDKYYIANTIGQIIYTHNDIYDIEYRWFDLYYTIHDEKLWSILMKNWEKVKKVWPAIYFL